LSSLRTRAVEEPLPCSIQPSMSITQFLDNIPLPRSAEEVLASDGIHATSIVDNTGLGIGEMISVNDDSEIQLASDDEYDTQAEREELGILALMVQESEPSNHGPEQISLSQSLGIQLEYIQPKHHHNSFLPTCVFDDIFHVQN